MKPVQDPLEQLLELARDPNMRAGIHKNMNFDSFEKRFIPKYPLNCFSPANEDKCWDWQGALAAGYGQIGWESLLYYAHRLSYILFNGTIPKEALVRHTCDNPSCVNPKHLITGTHSDNAIDSVKRGRHHSQRLNEEDVKDIKWQLCNQPSYGLVNELARQYGVSHTAIGKIKSGKSWGWV